MPTPIDADRRPDLTPLRRACATVGAGLRRGDVVVFEVDRLSGRRPRRSAARCWPRSPGSRQGIDFTLGYSPERINPGDREHRFESIAKVVCGQDAATARRRRRRLRPGGRAGLHRAPSIKVAETAKVIENTQRDLNIALMNELALIFDRLGIRTGDVLGGRRTKWNFLPFSPGLVGGHCIGVDPYYLTAKAERVGLSPAGDPGRPAHQRRHGRASSRRSWSRC